VPLGDVNEGHAQGKREVNENNAFIKKEQNECAQGWGGRCVLKGDPEMGEGDPIGERGGSIDGPESAEGNRFGTTLVKKKGLGHGPRTISRSKRTRMQQAKGSEKVELGRIPGRKVNY